MKKAKIILSAVALFAVVGGALAFKATRVPTTLYLPNANGQCLSSTTGIYTTVQPNTTTLASFAPTTDACPLIQFRIGE